MIRRFVVLLTFVFLFGCVSSAEDFEIAHKVAKYLDATGVVPRDDARKTYTTHSGKMVYVGPGINGSPHFTYYEITSPDDMRKLEIAAQEALVGVPEVKKITLHFMEKEVFHQSPSGARSRGHEKEINRIVIKK